VTDFKELGFILPVNEHLFEETKAFMWPKQDIYGVNYKEIVIYIMPTTRKF
jgi:hypothetical protein